MTYPKPRGSISPACIALSNVLLAMASGCDGGMASGVVGMGGALVIAQSGAPGTSGTTGGGATTTNGSAAGAASSAAGAASVTGGGTSGANTTSTPPVAGSGTLGFGGLGGAGGTLGASGMTAAAGMGDTGGAGADTGGAGPEGGAGGAPVEDPTPTSGEPVPSSGCGQTPPASERYDIDVDGLTREYILEVPDDYDPETPYRLVFGWHPWGGSADWVAQQGYYGLLEESGGQAIFVSGEGLDFGGNGLGWGNENGQDIAFMEAMLDRFDEELCFDHSRVFSTGFSFGGMMSNAVACSGLARAVAPMAGSGVSGCADGSEPVAYMGFHGVEDSVVGVEGGRSSRDILVERNGCGAEIASTTDYCDGVQDNYQPCECVTYEGCQEGYPVTWCEYNSDHMVAPSSAATIWSFFSEF